jgi:glucose-1-phosphate thymidylyltransferase
MSCELPEPFTNSIDRHLPYCMRAIIPVAGVGSRLRPHTYTQPKVLLNVAGKPIIAHIMDRIVEEGIKKATIIVGYLGDRIRQYLEKNYDIELSFIYQEERRGLGHAIYTARETFQNDPLFIILGDTVFDVELKSVLKDRKSSLGVKTVDDPRRFGVAITEDGFVTKLVEKPDEPVSNLALVGLYIIHNTGLLTESLDYMIKKDIRTRGEYQLTDALQLMIERGERMTTFPVEGWYDCGKPETLLSTNRHLLDKAHKKSGQVGNGTVIIPPVYISPSVKINHSIIGPYTTIAENAVITNSIVRNSIIGAGSEVETALLDNSIIGNEAYVKGNFKRINVGDSSEIDFSNEPYSD